MIRHLRGTPINSYTTQARTYDTAMRDAREHRARTQEAIRSYLDLLSGMQPRF